MSICSTDIKIAKAKLSVITMETDLLSPNSFGFENLLLITARTTRIFLTGDVPSNSTIIFGMHLFQFCIISEIQMISI